MKNMGTTPEYIARIRLRYNELRNSERKLADYFLQRNLEEPLNDSVKQLAQNAQVSVASVIRFCQELGYEGYAEFKLMTRQVGFLPTVGNITLNGDMPASELKKNICDFAGMSIQKCVQSIDDGQLEKAVSAISGAKRLMICGIGTAAGIAVSAANTFMNLNIPSFPLSEELLMLRTVSMLEEEDVVLGITNCGYVKPVVDALKVARETGAVTILITGEEQSLAQKYADYVLRISSYGNSGLLDILTVTSCQLITIQILQAGCITRMNRESLQRVYEKQNLSEMGRYAQSVEEVHMTRVKF
ncbi:MAG: MurR/RpiR family transcriptional regulator [Enterocloster sp.]